MYFSFFIIPLLANIVLAKKFLVESTEFIQGSSILVNYTTDEVTRIISTVDLDYVEVQDFRTNPSVINIEEDNQVELPLFDVQYYTPNNSDPDGLQTGLDPYLWGLDISDGNDDNKYNYTFTGVGVKIYVIDTGIFPQPEFGSRILPGVSFVPFKEHTTLDCHGHGTHTSSTAAGTKFGIAKEAFIVPVRVFDCTGGTPSSLIIKAVYWIIEQGKSDSGKVKGIINMSLGGAYNSITNKAVSDAVKAGFIVSVSSGNSGQDANYYSPASEPSAVTVGAYEVTNGIAYYSNEGSVVDLFAPGSSVLGAHLNGNVRVLSGTSMASPHVAGALALIVEYFNYNANVDEVIDFLLDSAEEGQLKNFKMMSSPNLSLRTPLNSLTSRSPTPAPTVNPYFCSKIKRRKTCNTKKACKWLFYKRQCIVK